MKHYAMKLIFVMLLAVMLAGCASTTDWVHPNIANPRTEDKVFEEHSAACWKEVDMTYADTEVNSDEREQVFEQCMKSKGWEKSDWW